MTATASQLTAVLAAADRLLRARLDGMVTVDEWAELARAVGACTDRQASDLLTERDLEQIDSGTDEDPR